MHVMHAGRHSNVGLGAINHPPDDTIFPLKRATSDFENYSTKFCEILRLIFSLRIPCTVPTMLFLLVRCS